MDSKRIQGVFYKEGPNKVFFKGILWKICGETYEDFLKGPVHFLKKFMVKSLEQSMRDLLQGNSGETFKVNHERFAKRIQATFSEAIEGEF